LPGIRDFEPGRSGETTDEPAASGAADLVRRIVAGDRDAERELAQRYERGIRVMLARTTRDRHTRDDLFQETFRLAIEKIRRGDVREPDRLSGFIVALARNLAIDHYRRAAQARLRAGDAAATAELPSGGEGPVEQLVRDDNARIVRQVLSEMHSPRDREILFRYYLDEQDKERVCADLGLTSVHFNRVLFRARERFRELYLRAAGGDRGGAG
jgi:RNA polymerase sigma-70 factor (ECF subfamily)